MNAKWNIKARPSCFEPTSISNVQVILWVTSKHLRKRALGLHVETGDIIPRRSGTLIEIEAA